MRALLADGAVTTDAGTRALAGTDLAVVVPHVAQAAQVAAALHDQPDVLVGTANQLKGLERHAVVVLHPLAGHRAPDAFGIDSARLCVALSRHRSHATIVLDRATPTIFDRAPDRAEIARHRGVLRELGTG